MQQEQQKEYATGVEEDLVAYTAVAKLEPTFAEKSRLYYDTLLKNAGANFDSNHVILVSAINSAILGN